MKSLIKLLPVLFINVQITAQEIKIDPHVKMLALGDSYTIGESVGVEERWPHQFVAGLREQGITADTPDYIARTGWTTGNLLAGIESQLDVNKEYNLVSILIGVNNQYQGLSISIYEPELKQIVEIALNLVDGDASRVFMVSIPDYAYTLFGDGRISISEEIDTYNRLNKEVAAQYGISYVNITPISRKGLEEPSLVASDGLHPSGDQYARWVEVILQFVSFNETSTNLYPAEADQITIHPNPSNDRIRITSEILLERIRIFRLSGEMVHEAKEKARFIELDLSILSGGYYLVEAVSNGTSFFHPLILL